MPLIQLYLCEGRSRIQKERICASVINAVSDAFDVAQENITLLQTEFKRQDIFLSDDRMILLLIHCFAGRSPEQKRKLYCKLNEDLSVLGENPQAIQITIEESPLDNWCFDGVCAKDYFTQKQKIDSFSKEETLCTHGGQSSD